MSEPKPSAQYHTGNNHKTISIARIIAEKTIPYRPSLKGITGSTNSAILIQQMAYWWYKSGEKPFYKFLQPCQHEKYVPGDSWAEELGFSYDELKSALVNIAGKVVTGTKKTELSQKYAVIYWTDSDRLTWWQFNPMTFEALYNSGNPNYLGNWEKPNYLENGETQDTQEIGKSPSILFQRLATENTTDINNKVKLPDNASLDWQIAAGLSSEQMATLSKKEIAEREKASFFEQKMGYNPLPWWSDAKLKPLLKFLMDKSPDAIEKFAIWSKAEYSPLSPSKARQHPDYVIECWPQAFESKTKPRPKPISAEA